MRFDDDCDAPADLDDGNVDDPGQWHVFDYASLLLCNLRSPVVDHVLLQLEMMWMRVVRSARWPAMPQTPQLISTIVTNRVDIRPLCDDCDEPDPLTFDNDADESAAQPSGVVDRSSCFT